MFKQSQNHDYPTASKRFLELGRLKRYACVHSVNKINLFRQVPRSSDFDSLRLNVLGLKFDIHRFVYQLPIERFRDCRSSREQEAHLPSAPDHITCVRVVSTGMFSGGSRARRLQVKSANGGTPTRRPGAQCLRVAARTRPMSEPEFVCPPGSHLCAIAPYRKRGVGDGQSAKNLKTRLRILPHIGVLAQTKAIPSAMPALDTSFSRRSASLHVWYYPQEYPPPASRNLSSRVRTDSFRMRIAAIRSSSRIPALPADHSARGRATALLYLGVQLRVIAFSVKKIETY
ncbi:hypothetical protein B0H11DRAFT_1910554 [Mycena galericulata]|nr:hypothetical protein B0H11DRAFT_1910554 [Mycena galericulata]